MDVKWNNTTAINFCSTEADAVRWCNRVDEEVVSTTGDRLYMFMSTVDVTLQMNTVEEEGT